MNMTRWMMVAALGMLSSIWAKADIVTGEPYTITADGWEDQNFNFIPTTGLDTGEFTNPDDFCPSYDACFDPSMGLGRGGKDPDESGTYGFSTGTELEVLDEVNTGQPINEVLLLLTSNDGQLYNNQLIETFSCNGGTGATLLFTNCGFNINPTTGQFAIAFWNVPEPSQWLSLLLAFAALIAARVRRKSASSSFAQSRR
jgi:hypothetical protein